MPPALVPALHTAVARARTALGGSVIAHAVGIALALVAALYRIALASEPTNDDFGHLMLARQLLAGDWPMRDFYDNGLTLMYVTSAASQVVFGNRLGAEAVVVGTAFAVSTYVVFELVRRLTASTVAAALSAVLIVLAGPRGYSYPKIIVYAVAGALWWRYVFRAERGTLVALGAWTAIAFYWRPDHGAYVAAGVALALFTRHGPGIDAIAKGCQAALVTLVLLAPFGMLIAGSVGVVRYIESVFALAEAQHMEMDSHAVPAWPVRTRHDVIRLAAREEFAPVVSVRWTADSTADSRNRLVVRHLLDPVGAPEGLTQAVRLSRTSRAAIRDLINEPIVEDTAGIDRPTSSLPWSTWPIWERWRFHQVWLRVRVLSGLDGRLRASEAAVALFYALPLVVLLTSRLLSRGLSDGVTHARLSAFALLALVVDLGLLRTPHDVRAVDGVVLPAILFGCCVAAMWRVALVSRRTRWAWLPKTATLFLVALTLKSVAVSGDFGDRVNWLAGEWRSLARFQGTWRDIGARLAASPPLEYWKEDRGPDSVYLARYVNECLPASERLAVLWFAPEIYYYADRLMALRHFTFAQGWASLVDEQRLAVERIEHFAPPIVLARPGFENDVGAFYPGVADYVEREYAVHGTYGDGADRYVILALRSKPAPGSYSSEGWPCYARRGRRIPDSPQVHRIRRTALRGTPLAVHDLASRASAPR